MFARNVWPHAPMNKVECENLEATAKYFFHDFITSAFHFSLSIFYRVGGRLGFASCAPEVLGSLWKRSVEG